MIKKNIPFHKPSISQDEIKGITKVLESWRIWMWPKTIEFENIFSTYSKTKYCLTTSSWTTWAHLVLKSLWIGKWDEVIIPSMTFVATAEAICYTWAKPILVDCDKDNFCISVPWIEKKISSKTKAIIVVHMAGQPCDMDDILILAKKHNLKVIEDAAHALPATYKWKNIWSLSDATIFSFYASKTITTGEWWMICTNNSEIFKKCKIMRLHWIDKDIRKRYWNNYEYEYDTIMMWYKYNMTDIQSALWIAQFKKLYKFNKRREKIAQIYNEWFNNFNLIEKPIIKEDRKTSRHLYIIQLNLEKITINRNNVMDILKEYGIITSIHFKPIHLHTFYKKTYKYKREEYPISNFLYERFISLPIWPDMKNEDAKYIIKTIKKVLNLYKK